MDDKWQPWAYQGNIREKSGNFEMDDKWQPWAYQGNIREFLGG